MLAEGDVVKPIEAFASLPAGNYRVIPALDARSGRDLTGDNKFLPTVRVEDVEGAVFKIINSKKLVELSDFNWSNIEFERARKLLEPVIDDMLKEDRTNMFTDYDATIHRLLLLERKMEATANETSKEEYIADIVNGISSSLANLATNPYIKNVEDKGGFKYVLTTDIITCQGKVL